MLKPLWKVTRSEISSSIQSKDSGCVGPYGEWYPSVATARRRLYKAHREEVEWAIHAGKPVCPEIRRECGFAAE